jgi:ATP-dependent Clp protease ATP-binding subunit ClpA
VRTGSSRAPLGGYPFLRSLEFFGVTLDRVRSGVETIIGLEPPFASPADRGVTPKATRVIEFAQEEAAQRGSPRIEPEHLLLGVTREVRGVAAQALRDLQVSHVAVANTRPEPEPMENISTSTPQSRVGRDGKSRKASPVNWSDGSAKSRALPTGLRQG